MDKERKTPADTGITVWNAVYGRGR